VRAHPPTGKHTHRPPHTRILSHRGPCCSPRRAFALTRDSKWFNNHGGWDLDWARHQKSCPTDGCQTCKEPSDFSSWIHDKNVKLILLERSASLPHFISEMKQHAFDTHRCTDSECAEKVAKQKVRVDLAQMHRWFNYTTEYWDMMKDFARHSSLERQFFTYDEMCDRPQARGATSNLRRATLPPLTSPTLPPLTLPSSTSPPLTSLPLAQLRRSPTTSSGFCAWSRGG